MPYHEVDRPGIDGPNGPTDRLVTPRRSVLLPSFLRGVTRWTGSGNASEKRRCQYRENSCRFFRKCRPIVAILLSVAALALDIVIAYLGLQTVTFGW
jgi:hypothetical protein